MLFTGVQAEAGVSLEWWCVQATTECDIDMGEATAIDPTYSGVAHVSARACGDCGGGVMYAVGGHG